MTARQSGLDLDAKELKTLRSARRQQGLYQIYADFCDSETATCDRCPLVRILEC